jgi:hypothetical protein
MPLFSLPRAPLVDGNLGYTPTSVDPALGQFRGENIGMIGISDTAIPISVKNWQNCRDRIQIEVVAKFARWRTNGSLSFLSFPR